MDESNPEHKIRVRIGHKIQLSSFLTHTVLIGFDDQGELLLSSVSLPKPLIRVRIEARSVFITKIGSQVDLRLGDRKLGLDEEVRLEDPEDEFSLAGIADFSIQPEFNAAVPDPQIEKIAARSSELAQLEEEIQSARLTLENLERELTEQESTTSHRKDALIQDLLAQEEAFRLASERLAEVEEKYEQINDLVELEARRRAALSEALAAELKAKRFALEASMGEIELKSLAARRDLQEAMAQTAELKKVAEVEKLNADQTKRESLENLARIRIDTERAQDGFTKSTAELALLQTRTSESELRLAELNQQIGSFKERMAELEVTEQKRVDEDLAARRAALEQELRDSLALRTAEQKKVDDDLTARRSVVEEELRNMEAFRDSERKRVDEDMAARRSVLEKEQENEFALRAVEQKKLDDELAARRAALEKEMRNVLSLRTAEQEKFDDDLVARRSVIEQELQHQRERGQREFEEKGKEMERELQDAKNQEMTRIKALESESQKLIRSRRQFIADEIIARVSDMQKNGISIENSKPDLAEAIHYILDGRSAGTLNARAAERSREFWKRVAVWISVPAAVALFFAAFPGFFSGVSTQVQRMVASEKKDSGAFLKEIQKKGEVYQPEMKTVYRDNYRENILYLQHYTDMKLDEKQQTDWTLVLNDFLVGRLGLSDRTIPEFMASETVMIKDLIKIREGILPQFKDQGLARMAEAETQGTEKILALLQSPENYAKFRDLEKSYYERFNKSRAPAQEQKRSDKD